MKTVTINGATYPACFSLRVAINTADKYGSVQHVLDRGTEAENVQKRIWLLHELMVAGKTYAEKETGEKAQEVPSYDDLLDTINFADIGDITMQILQVLSGDQQTKIAVEGKKDEPTLDQ